MSSYGKVEPDCATINKHKQAVLDLAFSPFKSLLCTASADCTVKIWDLDLKENLMHSFTHGHSLRCVEFSKTVDSMLVTCAMDQKTRIFNIEAGSEYSVINTESVVNNISSNYDGTMLVHACKDGCLRIIDPRAAAITMKTRDTNVKLGINCRAMWCCRGSNLDAILTTSSISGQRLIHLFDPRKLDTEPICSKAIDSESGILFPMYDESSGVLFVAGKGDTIIRCYELNWLEELSNASIEKANEFKTDNSQPISGICMQSKRLVNVKDVEVTKFLKLTQNAVIPLSFRLPRANLDYFQDDVYKPIIASTPSIDFQSFVQSTPGSRIAVKLDDLKPDDMINLSEKPEEPKKVAKTIVFKEEIDKAGQEKNEREVIFARLSAMAIERQQYHPNLSGGNNSIPGKVDAVNISESEVAEDEWDD